MQFGLLYEMQTPRPWTKLSSYNIYHEALAQIELADKIGFDYVWEVEHHFLEEYSHSPPEVFYGAVSQRTKNILRGCFSADEEYPDCARRAFAAASLQPSD